nr:uncharacterized protein LOC129039153 [Pongo pygmaeus]
MGGSVGNRAGCRPQNTLTSAGHRRPQALLHPRHPACANKEAPRHQLQRHVAKKGDVWPTGDLFLSGYICTLEPSVHLQSQAPGQQPDTQKVKGIRAPGAEPGDRTQIPSVCLPAAEAMARVGSYTIYDLQTCSVKSQIACASGFLGRQVGGEGAGSVQAGLSDLSLHRTHLCPRIPARLLPSRPLPLPLAEARARQSSDTAKGACPWKCRELLGWREPIDDNGDSAGGQKTADNSPEGGAATPDAGRKEKAAVSLTGALGGEEAHAAPARPGLATSEWSLRPGLAIALLALPSGRVEPPTRWLLSGRPHRWPAPYAVRPPFASLKAQFGVRPLHSAFSRSPATPGSSFSRESPVAACAGPAYGRPWSPTWCAWAELVSTFPRAGTSPECSRLPFQCRAGLGTKPAPTPWTLWAGRRFVSCHRLLRPRPPRGLFSHLIAARWIVSIVLHLLLNAWPPDQRRQHCGGVTCETPDPRPRHLRSQKPTLTRPRGPPCQQHRVASPGRCAQGR